MLGQVLLDVEKDTGEIYKVFWCEGCRCYHYLQLNENFEHFFVWDANEEYPTFSPSVIIKIFGDTVCHFKIVDGMIHYFPDCKHEFSNLTIPLSEA